MKRLFTVIVVVVLVLSLPFCVCAEEVKKFAIDIGDVNVNRYFEFSVSIDNLKQVSGGRFQLSFDGESAEFISAKSDDFDVKTKSTDGAVDVLFVPIDEAISGCEVLKAKFKYLHSGSIKIDIKDVECVDKNLVIHQVEPVSCVVNIDPDEVSKDTRTKKEMKTITDKSQKSEVLEEVSEEHKENAVKLETRDKSSVILYFAGGTILLAIMFILGLYFNRKSRAQKLRELIED